ncbi:MAG TPA: urease accessory protein UreH, partial [Polyangia bacterium]
MGYSLGWLLGMLLGMRHALEPDHLAAVSTLVASERSARRGALLGMYWGIGHSVALFAVGGVLAALHRQMPARAADAFELAVAVMLVALGVRAMRAALASAVPP